MIPLEPLAPLLLPLPSSPASPRLAHSGSSRAPPRLGRAALLRASRRRCSLPTSLTQSAPTTPACSPSSRPPASGPRSVSRRRERKRWCGFMLCVRARGVIVWFARAAHRQTCLRAALSPNTASASRPRSPSASTTPNSTRLARRYARPLFFPRSQSTPLSLSHLNHCSLFLLRREETGGVLASVHPCLIRGREEPQQEAILLALTVLCSCDGGLSGR